MSHLEPPVRAQFERTVITGAGGGLGRAFAMRLAHRGAKLVISDVDAAGAAQTIESVRALGAEAMYFECDVRSAEAVEALRDAADTWMGGTDLLINNAGVAVGGAFEQIPLDDWKFCLDVDLWGVIYGCRAFIPQMLARGEGHILNVASAAGLLCSAHVAPYNVAKAGVIALTETMRAEYADSGVKLSVLCPTFFPTGLADVARAPRRLTGAVEALMKASKLSAEEVAQHGLDAVSADQLYALPMRDGRLMWRLKRLLPGGFNQTLRVAHKVRRRLKS